MLFLEWCEIHTWNATQLGVRQIRTYFVCKGESTGNNLSYMRVYESITKMAIQE